MSLPEVLPGSNVGFNVKNVDVKDLKHVFVASKSKDEPAKEATLLEARERNHARLQDESRVLEPYHSCLTGGY